MALTFDEAIEHFRNNTDISGTAVFLDDVEDTLKELRKEYEPTIEMTKNDRDILLYNLQNYPFDVFAESITLSDKEKFGLPENKEFKGLSIENLMQAWLHPETIKVIGEYNDQL